MNKKDKLLKLFKELFIQARRENSEFIESIPVDENRLNYFRKKELMESGFQARFPPKNANLPNADDINEKISEIGREILTKLFIEIKDEVVVDFKGHNKSQSLTNLEAIKGTMAGKLISVDSIVRSLAFRVGINAIALPESVDDSLNEKLLLEGVYEIFDYDFEDSMKISNRTDLSCRCCGDEINPLLDINTLKITLHPTPDYKSSSISATLEPRDCRYPNGIGEYSGSIKTPSKRLVVANDLRSIIDDSIESRDDYIDSKFSTYQTIGTCQLANVYTTEYYAKRHNMMYLFTGDGGITLFQDKTTMSINAKSEYIYNPDTDVERFNGRLNEVQVGYISFSLWAICAMDYEQFENLCHQKNKLPQDMLCDLDAIVVEVEQEITNFTSYYFKKRKSHEALFEVG